MELHLFFSVSFIFGIFLPTARSNKHHILFNWWDACTKIGGQCKNQCGHGEFRIIYCARPTTHCCVKECDPTQ
ncbi:beta-defensin 112 [Castor canadensis]|uniref:Beta-defensin 112 n=1 Tax=Castor canadensis TaxID=51338 RepID=A0AC58NB85_CASCN